MHSNALDGHFSRIPNAIADTTASLENVIAYFRMKLPHVGLRPDLE